jgi:hypothetical protein
MMLKQKIDNIIQQNIRDKKELVSQIAQSVRNYVNEIRGLCGIIIGAANFITKHRLFKKSVKFHNELILNTVQRILSILDEMVKTILEFSV